MYFDPVTFELRDASVYDRVDAYTRRRILTRLGFSPLEPTYGTYVVDSLDSREFSVFDVQTSAQAAMDAAEWIITPVVSYDVIADRLNLFCTGQVAGVNIRTRVEV